MFGAADAGLLDGPLRTVLPPLAVLLPGALVVNGMSELAAGHMQAGSARLTYGLVQLGLFSLGLLMATTLLRVPSSMLANLRVDEIGWVGAPVGLLLIGLSICLMEGVPLRMQGWVLLVLSLAFGAQVAGQRSAASPSVASSAPIAGQPRSERRGVAKAAAGSAGVVPARFLVARAGQLGSGRA